MSGSTIGGVVGAVVGFWVGGPTGAQYGWMIGSAVGGYVDPTQVFGPRLQDTRGQTSAVGGAIPRAWGTAPVPGNIIWQQPGVTEHRHTDDGKGSGTEQVTYTYTRSYAIMFHLGEIAGVLQIKRNGKIVYDKRDEATLLAEYEEAMGPVSDVSDWTNRVKLQFAMNSKWSNKCRIYTGTQTQEPDPTIEAYLGVGNAPAYRGRAYMVVTDDETQAGEIAQYEIIVAACGTVSTSAATGASWLSTYDDDGNTLEISPNAFDWSGTPFDAPGWEPGIGTSSAKHGTEILFFHNGSSLYSPDFGQTRYANNIGEGSSGLGAVWLGGYWHVANVFGASGTLRSADGLTFTADGPATNALGKVGSRLVGIRYAGDPGQVRISDDYGDSWTDIGFLPLSFNPSAQLRLADDGGSTLACICVENGSFGGAADVDRRAHLLYTTDGGVSWDEADNPFPDQLDVVATTYIHYALTLGLWVVVFHNRVAYGPAFDALTLSPHVFPEAPTHVDSDAGLIVACGANGMIETSADGEDWEPQSFGSTADIFAIMSLYDPASQSAIPDAPAFYVDENGTVTGPPTTVITPCATTTVGAIVADICALSGLTADEIDVSQLTDTLDGYVIARETDAASVIESLRPVGMFDPAEWDGKLRFIKRGGTAVGSINGDDLVERDGDAVEREMVQEVELLRKVSVGYLDTQAAWAPNTQAWERTVGTIAARGESVIEVTAVMGANQSATTAKRKVFVSWGEPEKQRFSLLSLRHAKYTPTDILNYTDSDAEVHPLRLMQIEDDSGIREIESSLNCAEAYNTTATGVAPKPPTITDETLRGPTYAVYMNLPSLRTQDNVPGVTIAACGMLSGWQGAAILLSEDDGVSYQQITTFTQPTAMGRLIEACTDSSEPIAVRMEEGSLSSITDAQLALRHNAFAIATDDVAELGQFKTATATGTNAYDLTENVRGGLGTTAASHVTGDPFVMVAAAQFVPLDISLAGRTLYFKAVTFGTSQDAAEAVPFVFNPLFTSVTISSITSGGEAITVNGQPIYVVTSNA